MDPYFVALSKQPEYRNVRFVRVDIDKCSVRLPPVLRCNDVTCSASPRVFSAPMLPQAVALQEGVLAAPSFSAYRSGKKLDVRGLFFSLICVMRLCLSEPGSDPNTAHVHPTELQRRPASEACRAHRDAQGAGSARWSRHVNGLALRLCAALPAQLVGVATSGMNSVFVCRERRRRLGDFLFSFSSLVR